MTTPEQNNERPDRGGSADDAVEADITDAGRPRIRPGPGEDPEPSGSRDGSAPAGDLTPDQTDAGRPRIRPGPGEG